MAIAWFMERRTACRGARHCAGTGVALGGTVRAGRPAGAGADHDRHAGDGLTAGAVKVKTKDGRDMDAYRAMPASGQGFGTILVVQEIFGVHAHIADMCRPLHRPGYCAIAAGTLLPPRRSPDLHRITQAGQRAGVERCRTLAGHGRSRFGCRASPRAKAAGRYRQLGITGFCWGGRIVWMYARAHSPAVEGGRGLVRPARLRPARAARPRIRSMS